MASPKLLGAASLTPQEYDVLCSKDKTHSSHPGNRLFRGRIDSMKEIYRKTKNKQGKMEITKDIVRYLKEKHSARFLKRNGAGVWAEISDQAARDKVSHALRFATRRDKKSETSIGNLISAATTRAPPQGVADENNLQWSAPAPAAVPVRALENASSAPRNDTLVATESTKKSGDETGRPFSAASESATAPANASAYCGVIPEEHIEPSKWLLALRQGS